MASLLDLFTSVKSIVNAGLKITGSVTGPLVLTPADNPLTVSSTGKIASTGANNDGVDGGAGTDWNIVKSGNDLIGRRMGRQSGG